jgi:SNF2 family DNA or RNA helicase
MPDSAPELDLFPTAGATPVSARATAPQRLKLLVTIDPAASCIRLEWAETDSGAPPIAQVRVTYEAGPFHFYSGKWEVQSRGKAEQRHSTHHAASIRAQLTRLKKEFPVADADIAVRFLDAASTGTPEAPAPASFPPPVGVPLWTWIGRQIAALLIEGRGRFQERVHGAPRPDDPPEVQEARKWEQFRAGLTGWTQDAVTRDICRVTLNLIEARIALEWFHGTAGPPFARMRVRCTGRDELTWELEDGGETKLDRTSHHRNAIRAQLRRLEAFYPVEPADISAYVIRPDPHNPREGAVSPLQAWAPEQSPWDWVEDEILHMAEQLRVQFSPLGQALAAIDPLLHADLEREARREEKRLRQQQELQARLRETQRRREEELRRRERARQHREAAARAKPVAAPSQSRPSTASPQAPAKERPPLPPVPLRIELPPPEFQDTLLPLADLRGYFLRERAARWWVSNQSDDLLCLPYCRVERLDYQLRTALRVLGPLRGRALLSDEVGLGKTIEAGLVLKELLTRGMVQRFLVLTVPSLVDQWEEELADKFALTAGTTNHAAFRAAPEQFWLESHAIVASLHTLKQPAHLAVAQTVKWDLLIVDEAHYLRNRASQAWQAVNALPRQFLLLLTATPVQNSLEELYNLVTLLQPGQLPTPKEFHARFIDPKRPHQPREPEELRRLLGQVMVRNTRANAGLHLPPRRAETVLFEPAEPERAFWQQWEAELRAELAKLPAGQSSLWGRLLLQAAGSSPAAWSDALEKFPAAESARAWRERTPLETSWRKKCDLLPPLTRVEGGLVIFTQFLATQAALAQSLRDAGVETFVINGATPAEQRHPITEQFRKAGGALLLTHSGTEGRNLQFCHRLVNFDLPWNPMEIEQRIGRLHRLGQRHPVRIFNLVQAGTLQEHLLQLLQEKLNLFELVVGETGLILGEQFGSDEFAEEIFRRWRESDGRVAEALQSLGDELAAARDAYGEVKKLDETLFAKDYESL